MDADNRNPVDYYLLPRIDISGASLRLAESNSAAIETYQREDLERFVALAARANIEVAA
jgi:hypothetical protein